MGKQESHAEFWWRDLLENIHLEERGDVSMILRSLGSGWN
jgi:hypothetical protein